MHRGRELPDTIATRDPVLLALAVHKTSRLIARDRVTSTVRAPFTDFQDDAGPSEVDEAARGHGLRRAVGELLVCPYCLGLWVAAGFTGGLAVAPRTTVDRCHFFRVDRSRRIADRICQGRRTPLIPTRK